MTSMHSLKKTNHCVNNEWLTNMQLHDIQISMMENRLKYIMEREKVTASQLAREVGVDKGYLSRFLNGKINISLPKLILIADYLGYDIEFVKRKTSQKGR